MFRGSPSEMLSMHQSMLANERQFLLEQVWMVTSVVSFFSLLAGCGAPTATAPNAPAVVAEPVAADTGPIEPTAAEPVEVTASLSDPNVEPGGTIELIVRVKMAPGWHIYSANRPTGIGMPTTLELMLPKDVEVAGEWSYPESIPELSPDIFAGEEPTFIHEEIVVFSRPLKIGSATPPGRLLVTCELGYQACSITSCLPPKTVTLVAAGAVVEEGDL